MSRKQSRSNIFGLKWRGEVEPLVSQKCNKRSLDTWCRVIERDIRNKKSAQLLLSADTFQPRNKRKDNGLVCVHARCYRNYRELIENFVIM